MSKLGNKQNSKGFSLSIYRHYWHLCLPWEWKRQNRSLILREPEVATSEAFSGFGWSTGLQSVIFQSSELPSPSFQIKKEDMINIIRNVENPCTRQLPASKVNVWTKTIITDCQNWDLKRSKYRLNDVIIQRPLPESRLSSSSQLWPDWFEVVTG